MPDRNLHTGRLNSFYSFDVLCKLERGIAFVLRVRMGKVGKRAFNFNAFQRFCFQCKLRGLFNFYADPVHARVQRNMDLCLFALP